MSKNHLLQYSVKAYLSASGLILTSIFSGFFSLLRIYSFNLLGRATLGEKMSHFSVLSATLLSSKKLKQATVQKYWYIQYRFFKGMYSITLKVVLLTKYKSIIISNFPQFFFTFCFILCPAAPYICSLWSIYGSLNIYSSSGSPFALWL